MDNLALIHAARHGLPVVPVYFLGTWRGSHAWTGPNRQHFLCGCLASLAQNLETIGGHLVIRQEDPVDGLRKLIAETRAVAVHFNRDPDPFGKLVEMRVRDMCASLGIECHSHADATLHGPDDVLTQTNQPYRVYTPYSRNWLGLPKVPPLGKPAPLQTPAHLPPSPSLSLKSGVAKFPKPESPNPVSELLANG
ncbi:MAG: deoxyribodipyrimidine photo-lyase [Luteolibacter sp.]|nr:deoxyribodipyrimidine photo-lyase [Luteolibacter sp.]